MKRKPRYTLLILLFMPVLISMYETVPVASDKSIGCGSKPEVGSESPNCRFRGETLNPDSVPNPQGACLPGTNIIQTTILVPVTRSNMVGSQYSFILPDGSIVDADTIPDGMCATATKPVDDCTGIALGTIGLNFDDIGLPLVECSSYTEPLMTGLPSRPGAAILLGFSR